MPNELWIAGAGSGKTHKIITESIKVIEDGGRVLVVTYTTNNQAELRSRFNELYGGSSDQFVVKGLYSFYLEDMVRPYQDVVFSGRIASTHFNSRNPHINPKTGRQIPGRKETLDDGGINPLYYLTSCNTKAHTGLLAKLASQVARRSKDAPAKRLKEIYQRIFFDEVQDLIGWDYTVIRSLSKVMPNMISCVGDFRQTIYDTSFGHKAPKTPQEKLDFFLKTMRFERKSMPQNRRCIQPICDLGDTVHAGLDELFEKTESGVEEVPAEHAHHYGIFVVKQSEVTDYLATYQPMVLKWKRDAGAGHLPSGTPHYTFGRSKGLGFDRVLILPAKNHAGFLEGDRSAFDEDKTDESRNKLYVAITRARYSVAFVVEDRKADKLPFPIWVKTPL